MPTCTYTATPTQYRRNAHEPFSATTSEVVKALGVTHRMLQHADETGLITPSRSIGRNRRYSTDDMFAILLRAECYAAGVPLFKVQRLLPKMLDMLHGAGERASFVLVCGDEIDVKYTVGGLASIPELCKKRNAPCAVVDVVDVRCRVVEAVNAIKEHREAV